MIKVSATNLEAYRKYLEERISLDALLDTVLRRSEPNSMMIKGTLFHEMLQTSEPEKYEEYFSQDCIINARSFMNYVGSSRVDLQACKLEYSIVSPK